MSWERASRGMREVGLDSRMGLHYCLFQAHRKGHPASGETRATCSLQAFLGRASCQVAHPVLRREQLNKLS